MIKIKSILFLFLIIVIIFLVFKSWFQPLSLSTGDWAYKFPQTIREFTVFPYAWSPSFGNGFGGNITFLLALNTYSRTATVFFSEALHIPWVITEKIMWYWPYIVVSVVGSLLLFRRLITKNAVFALVSSLIFTTNTYALMVTGGGQMGVAMGYAMLPWVFWSFLSILDAVGHKKKSVQTGLLAGLIFSLQLLFDLRFAYVSVVFVGIYYLTYLCFHSLVESLKKTLIPFVVVPAVVTLLLHFFWIFPFVLFGKNPLAELGNTFSGPGIVSFLSFAKFENTISLLHPNWPENIFGKVYFMRPEFLVLPVLAFSSLLFLKKEKKEKKLIVLVLALSAFLGAFLAKGTSEPFGAVYAWAFEKIPGFMMFRDSTKWYGFVALSYCLLIPYLMYKASQASIIKKKISGIKYILAIIFILLWGLTISKAFTGELKGTFNIKNEPEDYFKLASFLGSQHNFFRTLWVPGLHQYSYNTNNHPAIPGADYYSAYNTKLIASKIGEDINGLSKASVKYIIVPDDTEGKIFLHDRKYSDRLYSQNVLALSRVNGIKEVQRFGKVVLFEIPSARDHFWSSDSDLKISYKYINPTKYEITLRDAKKGDVLVFSDSFDLYWIARSSFFTIHSSEFDGKLNSFVLSKNGDYSFEIYYAVQDWVNLGTVVSGVSLLGVLLVLGWSYRKSNMFNS